MSDPPPPQAGPAEEPEPPGLAPLELWRLYALADSAVAMAQADRPAAAAEAAALAARALKAAEEPEPRAAGERAVLLAEALVSLARLLWHADCVRRDPRRALTEEDPLYHFLELAPEMNSQFKLASDRLGALARARVQSDAGVSEAMLREFAALDREAAERARALRVEEADLLCALTMGADETGGPCPLALQAGGAVPPPASAAPPPAGTGDALPPGVGSC